MLQILVDDFKYIFYYKLLSNYIILLLLLEKM